ncbi:MAG TPA: hypothetical protein VKR79_00825 [Gaiellaceae bacterium]|nr:hypothetical protein [Gaiellaceae bacterium]
MYEARWSPRLRQGDILGEVFVPTLGANVKPIGEMQTLTGGGGGSFNNVILPGSWQFVMVVSHDCEFNEEKRNRFLVAKIEKVPGNLTVEQRAALRESNDVEARAEAELDVAGVNSFLLNPIDGAFAEESIADFTTITPLPKKLDSDYLKLKRAELEHGQRLLLRRKLAWFFAGRGTDDIPDDERVAPTQVVGDEAVPAVEAPAAEAAEAPEPTPEA